MDGPPPKKRNIATEDTPRIALSCLPTELLVHIASFCLPRHAECEIQGLSFLTKLSQDMISVTKWQLISQEFRRVLRDNVTMLQLPIFNLHARLQCNLAWQLLATRTRIDFVHHYRLFVAKLHFLVEDDIELLECGIVISPLARLLEDRSRGMQTYLNASIGSPSALEMVEENKEDLLDEIRGRNIDETLATSSACFSTSRSISKTIMLVCAEILDTHVRTPVEIKLRQLELGPIGERIIEELRKRVQDLDIRSNVNEKTISALRNDLFTDLLLTHRARSSVVVISRN
jgi:hypothetical protein